MGNVVGCRQSIGDHAAADGISEFEHSFAASLEDASPGVVPEPLAGYIPSTGPPPAVRRSSVGTISEPLTGRLITVHMMETELVVKEPVGVSERTIACIPYAAIRQLTWDHSQSALKVGHTPSAWRVDGTGGGGGGDGGGDGDGGDTSGRRAKLGEGERVFISFRVENSIDLEDELKRRASAEAKRTKAAGQGTPSAPNSIYLGMFASSHKPKPFQRKRPNLSSTVPGGELPSLKQMRSWSIEEHEAISRPQINSLRPKLAMDAVFLGENRFPLSAVEGLVMSEPKPSDVRHRSRYGEVALTFASVDVHLKTDCGKSVVISYDHIQDWRMVVVPGTGPRAPSGLELWVVPEGRAHEQSLCGGGGGDGEEGVDGAAGDQSEALVVFSEAKGRRVRRRVFLGLYDEDLMLVRNGMEHFWNMRREELRLPPKACSTHGRCVASIITLRGEKQSPALPTGRIDPLGLNGVNVRVGQVVQPSPKRGHINILPSPRALLGVEKKRTLRYNHRARLQWERVVLHQGWLRKRGGGAIKRWIWRYFVLYDTPQGHFLGYYNDVSEVPLFDEGRRERQLIDLCKVCFLRPEIGKKRSTAAELPPNAFSIITTERHWTLCADSKASVLEWLRMISAAIDEDVAVVDDGEILYGVRANWSGHRGECGPESPGTVHLGSMGMELRMGSSDSKAMPSPGHAKTGVCSSSYAISRGSGTRFWSFTDFYKWTIVLLHDTFPGLAVQCFTDDQFKTKESILLLTPYATQLALAIEHQVEKFMAVMHLRLEQPERMGRASSWSRPDDDDSTGTANASDGENDQALAVGPKGAGSPYKELHRVTSMNLETDPSAWGADDMRAQPGSGNNPFDSSSSDEDESEVSACTWGEGGHGSSGPVEPAKLTIGNGGGNPFDFSFDGDCCGEPRGTWEGGGAGGGTGTVCQYGGTGELTASVVLDDLSSGVRRLLPAIPPPSPPPAPAMVHSITPEGFPADPCANPSVDLQHFGVQTRVQNVDQLDPFASYPFASPAYLPAGCSSGGVDWPAVTPTSENRLLLLGAADAGAADARAAATRTADSRAADWGATDAGAADSGATGTGGKQLLSPAPLIFFGTEEDSSTCPTPPVTPFATPAPNAQTTGVLAHIRDEMPPPSPCIIHPPDVSQQPQNVMFGSTVLSPESQQSSPGSMVASPESQQSNPFARPELFPAASVPGNLPAGQVIYDDGSSPRVILEDRVKNGRTSSLRLRYEFRTPHQTTLGVGLPRGAGTPAVDVSFNPSIAGARIGSGEEEGGGARYLRQELVVTCCRAFSAPPEIALATGDDRESRLSETIVPLPVTVTTFVAGFPMSAEAFRHAWTALSSAEHMAQAVVSCDSTAAAGNGIGATWKEGYCPATLSVDPATVRRLLVETLGMEEVVCEGKGAVEEVDLVAAAGVLLASDTKGKAWQTCLVGVELHSETGAARVTSKSADRALAQGVQRDVLEGMRRLAAGGTEEGGPTAHV